MTKRYSKYGYFFILPFFIVYFIFSLYPIIYTFWVSLNSYTGYSDYQFIGLDNYINVFTDAVFVSSIINTFKIWGVNIVLQLGIAFILVMIFTDLQYKVRGLATFRLVYYLPNLIAATSVSLIFATLLNTNYGALNQFLYGIGLIDTPIKWLETPILAQLSVSVIQTWMWFGNSFIMLMAAAQAVPKEYFEAAVIDGAGRFTILKSITIPTIKPILTYVAVTSLIGGLQLFDVPFLLTDGKGAPSGSLLTTMMYSYNMAFKYNNLGYAAAITYVLFGIILGITILSAVIGKIREAK